MNKSTVYSLSLSITFFLLGLAGILLIAPYLSGGIFTSLSPWQTILAGTSFYALSFVYFASVILRYSNQKKRIIEGLCVFLLAAIAASFWANDFFIESFWLASAAGMLALSRWIANRLFDWLQTATLITNFAASIFLFTRPEFAVFNLPTLAYDTVRVSLAIAFCLSGLAAIIASLYAHLRRKEQWHLLSIPWLLWILLALLDGETIQLIVAGSLSFGLLSSEVVPWEKVVLREGRNNIGRRFFQIIAIGQGISLLIIFAMITAANQLSLEGEQGWEVLRAIGLASYLFVILAGFLLVILLNLSINGLFSGLSGETTIPNELNEPGGIFSLLRGLLSEPFQYSRNLLLENARQQKEYEHLLAQMITSQKRRMAQLTLLQKINLELESALDAPVAAQLTANAIQANLGSLVCAVMEYDAERKEMALLASSGPAATNIPREYRQSIQVGIIGRAARLRRSQLVSDTRLDPEYIGFENETILSEVVVPILIYNQVKGCIIVANKQVQAFDDSDIRTLETIALRLVSSWQRSEHNQRLTRLIQGGVSLSKTLDVEAVISQVADIAKKTLDARFIYFALLDKGGGLTRVGQTGYAPTLSSILNSDPHGHPLIETILNQTGPMRIRDIRKQFRSIATGDKDLLAMLGFPIRLHQASIGVLLAFGKVGASSFTENDEGLANLLASQAAASIETTWLYQELRTMLNTTTQLHKLSTRVIQAEQLTDAAAAMAETAYKLIHARVAGITLLNQQDEIETQVQIDDSGLHPGKNHPISMIKQTIQSGQVIMVTGEKEMAIVCVPLQTPRKQYGALWVEVPEKNWGTARFSENLQTLANQAAIALERSILLSETRQQAEEIEAAYRELETTYDQTLAALSSALDARDSETEGHSLRVARLACILGERIGFDPAQLKTLERGAILHDIGKIGISDTILLKPDKLNEQEWDIMRRHPDIGARIIEGIPFLEETLPIIRFHQERWDGSGYPMGLAGKEIPIAARIFAVVDVYDALTTDRPYRKKLTSRDALNFLLENAGTLFDREIVAAFEQIIKSGKEKSV
jgi:putative nucleotidyltransferase with HDIG domain